jgi:hypothetical protein
MTMSDRASCPFQEADYSIFMDVSNKLSGSSGFVKQFHGSLKPVSVCDYFFKR